MNLLLEIGKITSGAVTKAACVVYDAAGKVLLPGAANAVKFAGVAQHDAANGATLRLAKAGIVDVVAAAAIAPGEELVIADNAGRVQPAGAVAGTVYNIVGRAEEVASAAGDIIEMSIAPSSKNSAAS